MRALIGLSVAIASLPALAVETKLSGPEIAALLPTIAATGEATSQSFAVDGSTIYVSSGRPSNGRWRVEGDQYCSVWPPAERWACYDVLRDGDQIIWVDRSGGRTINHIELKQN